MGGPSRKISISVTEVKEYFKNFHSNWPLHQAKLAEVLGKAEPGYSFEEIGEVERIFRENFNNPSKIGCTYQFLLDMVLAYCCRAWMHYFGGEYFDTLSKKDVAYGYPQVINWGPDGFHWAAVAPHHWFFRIEEGTQDEPITMYYSRKLNFFLNSKEWNFKPKK